MAGLIMTGLEKGYIEYCAGLVTIVPPLLGLAGSTVNIGVVALLFMIVFMFSLKDDRILALSFDVVRIAMPLLVYLIVCSVWCSLHAFFRGDSEMSKKTGNVYLHTRFAPEPDGRGVSPTTSGPGSDEEKLAGIRPIRDAIGAKVREWLGDLGHHVAV